MIFYLVIRSTNRTSLVSTYFNSLVLVICSTFGEWRFRSIYLAAHYHLLSILLDCFVWGKRTLIYLSDFSKLRKLSAKHWVCLFVSDFLFGRLSLVQTTDPIGALAGEENPDISSRGLEPRVLPLHHSPIFKIFS